MTQIAASNYNVLAVGNDESNVAELFSLSTLTWDSTVPSYPYSTRIGSAAIVNPAGDQFFYVIGGYGASGIDHRYTLNTVARFDEEQWVWANLGSLNQKRHSHNVVFTKGSSEFLVVGGEWQSNLERSTTVQNEVCEGTNGKFACRSSGSTLTGYVNYPELFNVASHFCQS